MTAHGGQKPRDRRGSNWKDSPAFVKRMQKHTVHFPARKCVRCACEIEPDEELPGGGHKTLRIVFEITPKGASGFARLPSPPCPGPVVTTGVAHHLVCAHPEWEGLWKALPGHPATLDEAKYPCGTCGKPVVEGAQVVRRKANG